MSENISQNPTTVEVLLSRFIDGEDEAYSALYVIFSKDLYSLGLSFRCSTSIIEDAIHDVFVDIYSRRKLLHQVRDFKFYIFASFRHRLIYLLKKQAHFVEFEHYIEQELKDDNQQEAWISREEEKEKMDLYHMVMNALNHHQREAIHYRYIENFSYDDISALMGINVQSVKNLIHRAIKKIRRIHS